MLRNSGDGNRLKFLPQFGAFFQFAPDSGIGFVVNPGRNVNIPSAFAEPGTAPVAQNIGKRILVAPVIVIESAIGIGVLRCRIHRREKAVIMLVARGVSSETALQDRIGMVAHMVLDVAFQIFRIDNAVGVFLYISRIPVVL